MTRVCDLNFDDIKVGMRIKSLIDDQQGTVVEIDLKDDNYCWIHWDNEEQTFSGWYETDCKCEVISL